MRILFYDIETTPNLSYVWGQYEQNVLKHVKEWELLSFAWKYSEAGGVGCHSRKDYSEKELVRTLWTLMNRSDFTVAHNGDKFDLKKVRTKFLQFGFEPPQPSKSIDTLKLAKKYFNFNSNKLNDLCEHLGLGKKVHTGGFDLWLDCIAKKPAAFKKLEKYNKQDVVLLEKLYNKLKPWIYSQPGISLAHTLGECHNGCGFTLKKQDMRQRKHKKVQTYQCKKCGGWQ